jgi:hypothetical protein
MEREYPLPCSQEPSSGPCPESDRSSPYHLIPSKTHFNIVQLSTNLLFSLPSGLFPFDFRTNILYEYLFPTFVLHSLPISSFLAYSL